MGNTYAYITTEKHWYVYKRRIDTDGYEKQPLQTWKNISKETALKRFKHEMYAYSMQKYDYDNNTKAIYLYYGSTRVVRIGIMNNQLVSESDHNLQPFLEAQEELSPGRSPYLLNQFQKKWFRNYARLNVNSVGWVLLKENNNIH
tara:strand:+ start:2037 stop:2471 length:435 start_codon:yes stop_codon:yes gene_type:complete